MLPNKKQILQNERGPREVPQEGGQSKGRGLPQPEKAGREEAGPHAEGRGQQPQPEKGGREEG